MRSRLLLLLAVSALSACSSSTGPQGERGPQGEAGPQGEPGPAGATGAQGLQGPAGQGWTVSAGSGLTLTGSALGTDGAVLQRRVTGACGASSAVRVVNPDGSVACEPILDPRLGQPVIPNGSGSGGGSGIPCVYGQVLLFAGNFAPAGTMVADGRLLPISSNTALFSLLGTQYGGNGTTTFALPNLQPLAPAGVSYVICNSGVFPPRE